MPSKPTANSPAYEKLAARIKEQIVSGDLRVGQQLPAETELSAYYNVSRNTAREALRTLASQGLLVVRRGVGGGAFVSTPTPDQVGESLRTSIGLLADANQVSLGQMIEVREMLEVPATELAALRRTERDLASIRLSLMDEHPPAADAPYDVSRDFHLNVLQASHNPALALLARPMFEAMQARVERSKWAEATWANVDSEHREILGYLEVGDQAGARESARAHLRAVRHLYEEYGAI